MDYIKLTVISQMYINIYKFIYMFINIHLVGCNKNRVQILALPFLNL